MSHIKSRINIKTRRLSEDEVSSIEKVLNLYELLFSNTEGHLNGVVVYFVIQNRGMLKHFHTINDHVVVDKLDYSYITTRELLGGAQWNIKRILKFTFAKEWVCTISDIKSIHEILFNAIKPQMLTYAVYKQGLLPAYNIRSVTVNMEELGDISYTDYISCITATYNYLEGEKSTSSELDFKIVKFS